MKVFAHVRPDGSIGALVVQPEGDVRAMVAPEPGIEVCELTDHGLTEPLDVEQLTRLRAEHVVAVTPATGRLLRRSLDETA